MPSVPSEGNPSGNVLRKPTVYVSPRALEKSGKVSKKCPNHLVEDEGDKSYTDCERDRSLRRRPAKPVEIHVGTVFNSISDR